MADWPDRTRFGLYFSFLVAGVLTPIISVIAGGDPSKWVSWVYFSLTGFMFLSIWFPREFAEYSNLSVKSRGIELLPKNKEAAIIFVLLVLVTGVIITESGGQFQTLFLILEDLSLKQVMEVKL